MGFRLAYLYLTLIKVKVKVKVIGKFTFEHDIL